MNIIGIAGAAGSGKSTVARLLAEELGFVEVALADTVKRIVQQLYGFSAEQLWGASKMRNAPDLRYPREHGPHLLGRCLCCDAEEGAQSQCYLTPRHACQQLGTEFGRGSYLHTWTGIALRAAMCVLVGHSYSKEDGLGALLHKDQRTTGVVISDVRYEDELYAIRAEGGALWRIVRPGAGLAGAAGQHTSETSLEKVPDETFDVVLENNGDRGHLRRLVEKAVHLRARHGLVWRLS
jgi:hypothetical protein